MKKQFINSWTAPQLIAMSRSLGQSMGGSDDSQSRHQRWTAQQLLNLSAAKASLFN